MTRYVGRCLVIAALVAAAAATATTTATLFAQSRATAQNVPEIPFESVPNFLKMPADVYLGESMGVARNSKGNIFVYHRRDDTRAGLAATRIQVDAGTLRGTRARYRAAQHRDTQRGPATGLQR